MTTSTPLTTVRAATTADLEDLRAIYNHAVRHTDATLDTEEKTAEQMAAWLAGHGGRNAAVVAERDGHVLGYGTLSPFAARGGYFPSTEISVYVAPDAQGMGVGGTLTGWLVDFAREEGYSTIISFNTDTNIASIRMIERHGFVRTGLIRHIGVKLGRLVNLAVFQLVFPENLPRYQDEQDTTP
ncbi:phosphinothricin acetyltransferase [Saccharothrix saharensis]|uniref:Phosphinothricin acetyltransferase n=1 Tax=Saccharothrix saharensis TaxID=571190 RepID=A0A543J8V4_9PSEU|nr:GNAT family N-acetyltransferase [Saccharothrix saharensis]TQM79246.1 phosphinothricin acetyltransferase [Saccharothrix saharensis]